MTGDEQFPTSFRLTAEELGQLDELAGLIYRRMGGRVTVVRPDEDVVACMRREVREESDLECEQLLLRGTISWPGFGKGGEDWFGFIFRIDRWSGTPRRDNAEGSGGGKEPGRSVDAVDHPTSSLRARKEGLRHRRSTPRYRRGGNGSCSPPGTSPRRAA